MKYFLVLLLVSSLKIYAADTPLQFIDPDKAELYESLLEEIRCLVCQNQSLADSNAELAQDLRHEIESMINNNQSEVDIKKFLVERYGDFVLYRPPLQKNTWILWLGPFIFMIIGISVAIFLLRKQSLNANL